MRRWLHWVEGAPTTTRLCIAALLVALIAFLDFATGWEVSFSVFYLVPIALVAWSSGPWTGAAFSTLSAGAWLLADVTAGATYSHAAIPYWNTLVRLGLFLLASFGLPRFKAALANARTDALTGLPNRRAFNDALDAELARARRYLFPVTVAFLDVDGFKRINDSLGHDRGDDVLRAVADSFRSSLRSSDTAARLGGDEFAVVLPEADEKAARRALEKLHASLARYTSAIVPGVGVSIGAVTYHSPPESVLDVLRKADELMYAAKRDRSRSLHHESADEPVPQARIEHR